MNEELPDDFDVIVVGTGLTESIVSGALSRIGKKVLHLDHQKYYGGDWSSFNLKGFEQRMNECVVPPEEILDTDKALQKIDDNEEIFVPIPNVRQTVFNGSAKCHIKEDIPPPTVEQDVTDNKAEVGVPEDCETAPTEAVSDKNETGDVGAADKVSEDEVVSDETVIEPSSNTVKKDSDKRSLEYFYSKWRHFNLDLTPKLMFSRGELVELLIASNVCRYLEFRNVTGTLTLMESPEPKLVPVPCSRTDIFNSKLVTMVEKRLLMRILTTCASYESNPDEYKGYEDRTFSEFLASKKLSEKLRHFIIHSIAMVTEETKTLDGLKASAKFLKSLGRYGNSAFLWTTYGTGELPQAFCRLGAVFGGTFCLNRYPIGYVVSKSTNRCVAIIDSTGQRLKCDRLITNESYLPNSCRNDFSNRVSRAIYVTDKSFMKNGNSCLISIPPVLNIKPAWLVEISPACRVCPDDMYVVHAMMRTEESTESPQSHFLEIEKILFGGVGYGSMQDQHDNGDANEEIKPNILWASYFQMASDGFDSSNMPGNVTVVKGPFHELGFDTAISEARALFKVICPDDEFLPRAPNPEEIVYFDQNDEECNTDSKEGDNHTCVEDSQNDDGDGNAVDNELSDLPDQVVEK